MTLKAVPDEIFRAYDIRGIVGDKLNPDIMARIGQAIGSEALEQGEHALIVGADARLSSPALSSSLKQGILATGCNVIDIGIVPTPLLYFATHHLAASASGAMVTGSHNPGNYNGVKMVLRQRCLSSDQIEALKQRIVQDDLHAGAGWSTCRDISQAYIDRISGDIRPGKRRRVVIDCGNGVAGLIAPALFEALNCEVIPLYCDPDGHFPNHHPDPTQACNLQALIQRVKEERADLGVAFDGDADRVGIVSESGRIIDADHLMMCFIRDILPDNPGASVVFDVKSSQNLAQLVEAEGGRPVLCRSGHSFVKQALEESGALLGGEYSAHIFFRHRWYGFDDGMYAAARFLELLDKQGSSADAILDTLPTSVGTAELTIPVAEAQKFGIMATLRHNLRIPGANINKLDGVRADFADGWGLVRASNTTPNLVLRFEATSEQQLNDIMNIFRDEIRRLQPALPLTF